MSTERSRPFSRPAPASRDRAPRSASGAGRGTKHHKRQGHRRQGPSSRQSRPRPSPDAGAPAAGLVFRALWLNPVGSSSTVT
eukprot:6545916-Prymnesium_polylepis.1